MTAPQRLRPRNAPAGRAILGGSFNPPHVGHLRLAVEVREALGDLVTGVDLVPCAVPPHKDASDLLPFGLRAALVEACIAGLPWLACNRLEGRRQGPSYTWDTLTAYRQAAPGTDLYFILGSPDFAQLPLWRRGTELPPGTATPPRIPRPRRGISGPTRGSAPPCCPAARAWPCPAAGWRIFSLCPVFPSVRHRCGTCG